MLKIGTRKWSDGMKLHTRVCSKMCEWNINNQENIRTFHSKKTPKKFHNSQNLWRISISIEIISGLFLSLVSKLIDYAIGLVCQFKDIKENYLLLGKQFQNSRFLLIHHISLVFVVSKPNSFIIELQKNVFN